MNGYYDKQNAKVVIQISANGEKLEAPLAEGPERPGARRHWLPCEKCGTVRAVPWNVVSFVCDSARGEKCPTVDWREIVDRN